MNPKSYFLIDGLGALVSTFFLGGILPALQNYIGMPTRLLYIERIRSHSDHSKLASLEFCQSSMAKISPFSDYCQHTLYHYFIVLYGNEQKYNDSIGLPIFYKRKDHTFHPHQI